MAATTALATKLQTYCHDAGNAAYQTCEQTCPENNAVGMRCDGDFADIHVDDGVIDQTGACNDGHHNLHCYVHGVDRQYGSEAGD